MFILFSVILMKCCNRFSTPMGFKKNQTISFVRSWFMHIIRLKEKDMNSYHYFKSNPLGFRNNQLNNQNKQVAKIVLGSYYFLSFYWNTWIDYKNPSTPLGLKKNQTISLVRSWCGPIIRLKENNVNNQIPWDLKRSEETMGKSSSIEIL